MSLENYTLGAKIAANKAASVARPEAESIYRMPLRKARIVGTVGNLCTVQLLGDDGAPILDEEGQPVTLSRVPRYPQAIDGCVLWIDQQGVAYILNTGGLGGGGPIDWGVVAD